MYDYNQKPDLNITPLVDVMLVLLAIMMVTVPVIEFEEPINLPQGSKSRQVQTLKKINILITKDRVVLLNKKKYDLNNFSDNFILYVENKSRKTPIYIRADKTLIYDDIMYILRTVKESGFHKVSLVTNQ